MLAHVFVMLLMDGFFCNKSWFGVYFSFFAAWLTRFCVEALIAGRFFKGRETADAKIFTVRVMFVVVVFAITGLVSKVQSFA